MDDKWIIRFLNLAKEVSCWSKDPSTKVGAVIVRPDKSIASVGFNGFAKQVHDLEERYHNREYKLDSIIHAEINAIVFAKEPLDGYSLFIYPLLPCSKCSGIIINSGIKFVYAPVMSKYLLERWGANISISKKQMEEALVSWKEIDFIST